MTGGDPNATDAEGGPMWGRFFDSFDDNESALSGSHSQFVESRGGASRGRDSLSHIQLSPQSEVHPNDSASVIDDEPISALDGHSRHMGAAVPSVAALPVDDGTYVFKFRTPSGRTHRFQSRHDNVEHLREIVAGKLATDPFFTDFSGDEGSVRPDPIDFQLLYTDADGDTVLITSDHDVAEAVTIARAAHSDRVVLYVQGGKGWVDTDNGESEAKAAAELAAQAATAAQASEAAQAAAQREIEEVDKMKHMPPPTAPPLLDDIMGIPRDLLLPASIGALAVVIAGVFTISRLTASQY